MAFDVRLKIHYMKWINYSIGLIGVICLMVTFYLTCFHQDMVKTKNGTIYFTHDTREKGYGLAIQRHEPKHESYEGDPEYADGLTIGLTGKHVHRCAVFKGEVTSASFNYPFHPVVVEVDNDTVLVHVSFPKENDEHVVLSLSNSLETGFGGYSICSKSFSNRKENYIDVDGDYLPDKRITHFKRPYPDSGKSKIEVIRYSYTEETNKPAHTTPDPP
jgi:hypothetical protein